MKIAQCLVAISSVLVGCASTSARDAYDETAKTVAARTGHEVRFAPASPNEERARRDIDGAVGRLLERELTADLAVRVALLTNPRVHATLEELSIGQADLVEAGLLKNPSLGFGATAWESEHIDPNLFASIEQDFLDLLTLPMKKRIAATELEATKLRVADEILEITARVRATFYRAQAAAQVTEMRRLVNEAAQTSKEVAERQHAAGNMSDLALNTELTLAAQTALDLHRSAGEAAVLREELNKALGLWGSQTAWRLGPKLPEVPSEEPSLESLEARAIAARLDLSAMRRELQALDSSLSLAKATRWTGAVAVHVEAGRLRGSKRFSFGPSVLVEIPLFNQRTAAIARLEALKRAEEHELRELAIAIRADVRADRARVRTARAVVDDYGKTLVPLRESIVKLSQQQYDAMLLGVYQLLQAKQAEFAAYREYIEAVRDYWIAKSDLERTVGGRRE